MTGLVLGPLLRYVDESAATVWVETEGPATVTVVAGEHRAEARTFAVHGHHYALVVLQGLEPGSKTPYQVLVEGEQRWPEPDPERPVPVIPTLLPGKPLRMAFGSCRTSVGHDEEGNRLHGVDALQAYALRLAGITRQTAPVRGRRGRTVRGGAPPDRWPDLLLFLGDQVYADETTPAMRDFISARRDIDEEPGTELKDYEEYAHLYSLAWSDPDIRWLLATVPTAMIFDDHDIRDDWNTSRDWKDAMEATSWWHDRVVGGLASYWVYQHLGNLSPAALAEDPVWAEVTAGAGADDHPDLSATLDTLADRADQEPDHYRWSYVRDFDTQARLVVVDSRAARVLNPDSRSILHPQEMAWLDEQVRGGVDHLLIGTSLPFLLAPGLHYTEAFGEALAGGGWGRRPAAVGERLRQMVDLEHWAAFQRGFADVCDMTLEVAAGERGRPPGSVTFLSGDVHHSYVSQASLTATAARERPPLRSRFVQATCSPIRNPLSPRWRFATAVLSYGVAGPLGHVVARSAKVPDAPLEWRFVKGPWFDNNLATLELRGRGLRMWWATGQVEGEDHERPVLEVVADVVLDA